LGLALGLVVSGLATGALSSLLFGIEPLDGATYVGVALLLGVSSALASALPALAASRVDPRETLKAG
jgi:ABC-type antimicrobial peptide transport system permease subunit